MPSQTQPRTCTETPHRYIPTVTLHSYSRFPKVHLHSFNPTLRFTDGTTPPYDADAPLPPEMLVPTPHHSLVIHIPFKTGAPSHPHRRTFTYGWTPLPPDAPTNAPNPPTHSPIITQTYSTIPPPPHTRTNMPIHNGADTGKQTYQVHFIIRY